MHRRRTQFFRDYDIVKKLEHAIDGDEVNRFFDATLVREKRSDSILKVEWNAL